MTVVVDASVITSALVGNDARASWAETQTVLAPMAAPHLLPIEVMSNLRRLVTADEITDEVARLALAELNDLSIAYLPGLPHRERIWELRRNVTAFDAWYVALAEALGAALVTVDVRLASAPGPRCEFRTPGGE